jgi:hypothetical protein
MVSSFNPSAQRPDICSEHIIMRQRRIYQLLIISAARRRPDFADDIISAIGFTRQMRIITTAYLRPGSEKNYNKLRTMNIKHAAERN